MQQHNTERPLKSCLRLTKIYNQNNKSPTLMHKITHIFAPASFKVTVEVLTVLMQLL